MAFLGEITDTVERAIPKAINALRGVEGRVSDLMDRLGEAVERLESYGLPQSPSSTPETGSGQPTRPSRAGLHGVLEDLADDFSTSADKLENLISRLSQYI